MSKEPSRYYWDSCVFISLISGDALRVPVIKELMRLAEKGKIELFTSTFTIAEVAFATYEKIGQNVEADVEERIRKLWMPPSPVTLVEFHQFTAEECRLLIRAGLAKGWTGLKAKDGVHLATAKLIEVNEVHTYEPKLVKYGELIGAKVCPPWLDQQTLNLQEQTSSILPPSEPTLPLPPGEQSPDAGLL